MENITKFFKFFFNLSFRMKVGLALSVLSLLLTIYIGIMSYNISSNVILNMSTQLSEKNFEIAHKALETYFNDIEKNIIMLIRMQALRDTLNTNAPDQNVDYVTPAIDSNVRGIIRTASSSDKISVNFVAIYGRNGYRYLSNDQALLPFFDYESCIEYYTDNKYITGGYRPPVWCDTIEMKMVTGRPEYSFVNLRMLYNPATMEEAGILLLGVNREDISGIFREFSDSAFIMNKNGKIISQAGKADRDITFDNALYEAISKTNKIKDTLSIVSNDKTLLVTFQAIAGNDAYFVMPFDYYSGKELVEVKSFSINIFVVVLTGIIMSIVFAILISKGLSSSIFSLKKTLYAVKGGDLNARYSSKYNDEISYLGLQFNEMLDQINTLFSEQKEYERSKAALEIKLMQSQINPHMLYNTLDSVLWALNKKDIKRCKTIIYSLSNFFKKTLSKGNDIIPLRDELELLENYINIQKKALDKNFTINIDIPEALMDIDIIKLSIQPIVENVFMHGFPGYRDDDGIISITTDYTFNNNKVTIFVEDNGIGIDEERQIVINEILETYPPKTGINHFGLYNVQRRLRSRFGEEYGICFESELGCFTRVSITIPVKYDFSTGAPDDV